MDKETKGIRQRFQKQQIGRTTLENSWHYLIKLKEDEDAHTRWPSRRIPRYTVRKLCKCLKKIFIAALFVTEKQQNKAQHKTNKNKYSHKCRMEKVYLQTGMLNSGSK